jgi:hypothetical protein
VRTYLCSLLFSATLLVASPALAQDTDLTYTQPPVVFLAIDTSGSMQWRGTGIQRDDLAGISCVLGPAEKSREIVIKEVLTGTFVNYSLNTITPNGNSSSNYIDCATPVGVHQPVYDSQLTDGLLDTYRERLRFAFGTFDSVVSNMNDGSNGGDWSYPGTTSPSPTDGYVIKNCGFSGGVPRTCDKCNCAGTCQLYSGDFTRNLCFGNVGMKSESLNPCTGNGCLLSAGAPGTPFATQNDTIQAQVLGYSSIGNTPLAGMLKDIRYYFDNHPDVAVTSSSNKFVTCRQYHTIVLTDGIPNQDCGYSNASIANPEICFRIGSCRLDSDCPMGGTTRQWFCVNNSCQNVNYNEPSLATVQRAADLHNPPSGGKPVTVHAIGFDTPTAITCNDNSVCPFGQVCLPVNATQPLGTKKCSCITDANCDVGQSCQSIAGQDVLECRLGAEITSIAAAGGGQALFASDPVTLKTALNQIFAALTPETTSRTRPASTHFTTSIATQPANGPQPGQAALFMFQGAFTVPPDSPYWRGFLRRVTVGNTGTANSPVVGPLANTPGVHGSVQFDALLNTQPSPVDDQLTPYSRKIYTYKNGLITEFTKTNIDPTDLNVGTTTQRDQIVDFVRGEVGTARAANRLGAVYHSSPVILDPPVLDLTLSSYNTYKADTQVRQRPPMVFVGSNLGMLHAFNAQTAKEEWAFIPPALLPTLQNQLIGFTWGVDATAVARDIQMSSVNVANDSKANWRAVVVVSMGYGAQATVALDVTDPVYRANNDPPFNFLWQFDQTSTNPTGKLGIPFGSAVVGTVFLDDPSRGYPFQQRAVAIVPGGKTQNVNDGQDIWVLDLSNGNILKQLPGTTGGGMTGTCSAVDDFPGSFLTRAFCGDYTGNLVRINIADQVIANWTSDTSWHSLYTAADVGVTKTPIFAAPALAFRRNGDLVVLYGNGDPNDIQSTVDNRFAIVEEIPNFDASGVITGYTASTIKLLTFPNGEKLTGTPVIFNGTAYFTTFVPAFGGSSTSCSFGQSRIWGVAFDHLDDSGNLIPQLQSQCGADGTFDGSDGQTRTTLNCLMPVGSVSFGFDVLRTPTFGYTSTVGVGPNATTTTSAAGGDLKLVFQTGTAVISPTSPLRDPTLTPAGAQSIQWGSMTLPDATSRARFLSWGKVMAN